KGFAEPVEAFAVEGVAAAESRFEAARRGLTDRVGRAAESALLRHRLREAWAGAGQVVLLSGGAGLGKARLAARSPAHRPTSFSVYRSPRRAACSSARNTDRLASRAVVTNSM